MQLGLAPALGRGPPGDMESYLDRHLPDGPSLQGGSWCSESGDGGTMRNQSGWDGTRVARAAAGTTVLMPEEGTQLGGAGGGGELGGGGTQEIQGLSSFPRHSCH